MSNAFDGRVWVLDTAFSAPIAMDVYASSLRWKPNAADDTLIIKNSLGDVLFSETALAPSPAGDFEWNNPDVRRVFFKGFDLDTIGGGTLYVHIA